MGASSDIRATERSATTLERRIATAALLTALSVLFCACVVFALQMREMDSRSMRTEAREFAAVLAHGAAPVMEDRARVRALFDSLTAAPSVREAILYDAQGQPITAYSREAMQAVAVATLVEARVPIMRDGEMLGEVVVRAASHRFDPLFVSSLAICGALFFAAAAAAMFIGRWFAARLLGPVRRLSDAMAAVSESGDFSRLVSGVGDDELGRLTASFNELLLRLQSNDRELRRTLSDLVEARDAAQTASVQKSQFLANMSHEIRTPLNGVLAMTQVMARGELAPAQRKRLEVVRQSGEALLTVLNDVLDVSKIEAGKLVLEPMEVDATDVIRRASEAFHVLAEGKGLQLSVDITPEAEGLRRVDPLRLRQILANLLSNAVKFTERGSVMLRVDGEGRNGAGGLLISVSDTGIGINPQHVPYLFDKFTQGDNSTTRRFGGTGLGLSICRDLVEMMNGAIWAESEPGHGATFHVILPLARLAVAPTEPARRQEPPVEVAPIVSAGTHPLRVLAAEDNPANQVVLSTIMEVFGVSLEMVGDGRQAVEAWRRGGFDLVLMDIQMPELDGIEATRTIRAIECAEARRRTPIIALSANAMTHQVQAYIAAGMDAHVAKPIELTRLQAAMDEALTGRMLSPVEVAAGA